MRIGTLICKCIEQGMDAEDTLNRVRAEFPDCSTTIKSYYFYKSKMNKASNVRAKADTTLTDLRLKVDEHINSLVAKFRRDWPHIHINQPVVTYDIKGMKAGSVYYMKGHIRLNPVLLKENGQRFIDQTVTHEFVHHATHLVHGHVQAHGKEWQRMMVHFGAEPRTYHNYDTTNVRRFTKRVPYKCGCSKFEITVHRHKKILLGKAKYFCRKCGSMIERDLDK